MNAREQVDVLKHRFKNHQHQTDGFTWDYTAASDEDVFDTTNVLQDTIDGLSTIILKIINPKDRPALRNQIAYLTGLRQRQGEVWEKRIADFQTRTNNTKQWVLQNER